MVLHHVAQRAGLVVVTGTAFEADGFGHRDLHMVDMGGVPERLVERVGKAQRHQVLHRLLAEIVVDAEDLLFLEDLADRVVEFESPRRDRGRSAFRRRSASTW